MRITAIHDIVAPISSQIANAYIDFSRMTASVGLVKALGGGWDASTLPAPGAVLSRGGARTAAHGPDDER